MVKNKNGKNKKAGGCFGCLGCLGLLLVFGLIFGACSAIFGFENKTETISEIQEEPVVTEEEPVVELEQESEPIEEETPEPTEPVEEEPLVEAPVVEEDLLPVVEEEEPAADSVFYENCSAVRAAGAAPIRTSEIT
ncbi:hypothetical protein RG959_21435 [Domibacillus sp. 8LH]